LSKLCFFELFEYQINQSQISKWPFVIPALEANINMSNTLHFPKLNGSNYDSWATSIKSALQSHFLWLYVNSEEDMPTVIKSNPFLADRTSKEYKSWKED